MTLPPSVHLKVPFVSWEGVEERHCREINRSAPASLGMVLSYWGKDLDALEGLVGRALARWVSESREGGCLEDLKGLVSRGIPVLIAPSGLTPFAHPASPLKWGLFSPLPPDPHRVTSGFLSGIFVPLGSFRGPEAPGMIDEDWWWASRVVVGYDDRRAMILLHDPTFGPDWEVSYAGFDLMWEAGNRTYQVLHPPGPPALIPAGSPAGIPNSRPSRLLATELYVFGYALSSVGRNDEAETKLREGLAIPDLDVGFRYLLLNELGVVCAKKGNFDEALDLAVSATRLLPKHHGSYYHLSNLYGPAGARFRSWWYRLKATRLQSARRGSDALPRNLPYSPGML